MPPRVTSALTLFLEEAVGGGLFGLLTGYLAYRMLRRVDDYEVEILITLALVMGGYALATALHLSGPIATVVAGLLIGNHGRRFAMSKETREHLDTFWQLIDGILNAILFVLIGLEALLLHFETGVRLGRLAGDSGGTAGAPGLGVAAGAGARICVPNSLPTSLQR